jgi:transcriptional regulator with XRE-family HTH domain
MGHRLPNYLRAQRKRAGLSQKEVAFLLGCRCGAKVSRYERFKREPTLRAAIACAVVFHVPVRELFAGIYDDVARVTERRSRELARRLDRRRKSGSG